MVGYSFKVIYVVSVALKNATLFACVKRDILLVGYILLSVISVFKHVARLSGGFLSF